MKIQDFLVSVNRFSAVDEPEVDALREEDALDEAGLLGVRFNAVDSCLWLLVDCRDALQFRAGYTAIVVLNSVQQFEWRCTERSPRYWHRLGGWKPTVNGDHLTLEFGTGWGATFRATGESGGFYVGSVPGDDLAPPDLTCASDEEVRAGFAQWDSEFEVRGASHF